MAASVVTLKYTGDVNGISTDMVVSFERLPDYVLVAGVMQNRVKKYTFGAELYGDSGFGTILDLGTGSSWQIKIQIRDKFLVLISNPLGPGSPTVYTFKLVESK